MSLQNLNKAWNFLGMEFGTFKLKDGVSESELLKVAQMTDEMFLSKEDGFLGHVVLKDNKGLYADVAFATSQERAVEICAKWMSNEYALKYIEVIDPETTNMSFWEKIK